MPTTPEVPPEGQDLQESPSAARLRLMATMPNRLERSPEGPSSGRESTRKRLASVRETVQTSGASAELNNINHRDTRIPWEEVEEAAGPGVRFADYKNKPLWRRLGLLLELATGGNDSYGAHFRAETLGKLSDYQKADVVEQLERLRGRRVNWQTKMVSSLMKSHAEYELSKRGYEREEADVAPAAETVKVEAGQTLESIMRARNAATQLQEIADGTVVGPLQHEGALPAGTYVYFNPGGYPVYISEREDERPVVPLFRKQQITPSSAPRGWKGGPENYRRFEFMQKRLRVGDVIFTNPRRDITGPRSRGFYGVGRMLQGTADADETFPYIHSAVVIGREADGRTRIAHLDGQKQKIRFLDEYVIENQVEAMSIGRIGDATKATALAQRMHSIVQGDVRYATKAELVELSGLMERRRRSGGKLSDADKKRMQEICVCTAIVSKAGREEGVAELADAPTALDQFKNVDIVETLNFSDAAKRSRKRRKVKMRQAA